jgi:hypothetical protein
MKIPHIWIFHAENASFAGGAFSSLELAEDWISKHKLTGLLTAYPLDIGVYDWAIENGLFNPRGDKHISSKFIGEFTSASQQHYHYENGSKVA